MTLSEEGNSDQTASSEATVAESDEASKDSESAITSTQKAPGFTFYKGRPGLWVYSLHRITGTAILLFLIVHVADVAAAGWGREAYNTIHKLYETLFFRMLEVGLFGALLLHAINGVRIALVDFWSEGAERQEMLTAWAILAFVALFIPGATWMIYNFFTAGAR